MTTNVPSITGDGIKMAQKVGANLIDMGYIQLLPTTDPYTGATNHAVSLTTGIYLNTDGASSMSSGAETNSPAQRLLSPVISSSFWQRAMPIRSIRKDGINTVSR